MHHIAILRGDFLQRILDGEKTIESRWYKTRRAPWNSIKKNDTIYFKNVGKSVTAKATVDKVLQFDNLTKSTLSTIGTKYGKAICMSKKDINKYGDKNYCILIFLKKPQKIKPFAINKKGFGMMSAWMTMKNINAVTQ